MRTKTLEKLKGTGSVAVQDGDHLCDVEYDLTVVQEMEQEEGIAGGEEFEGLRRIDGTIRHYKISLFEHPLYTLKLEDGRCLDFIIKREERISSESLLGHLNPSDLFYDCQTIDDLLH